MPWELKQSVKAKKKNKECETSAATLVNSWQLPKIIRLELRYDQGFHSSTYSQENWNMSTKIVAHECS